jgi:alcohol dehydrogenase class IV
MRPFLYDQLGGRVVFGVGTIEQVPAEAERLAAGGNILLVADDMAKGEADWIEAACQGRVVARIGEIRPHVPMDDVDRARRIVNENAIDVVVTVGGGSTTGLGKAIVLEHEMPFLAVPTTYAGSEMTPIYGITGEEVKRTGRDPKVKPDTVVYDVELTLALPMSVTAGSVMNALAHCVEALYAEERNPIVDVLALEGVAALARGSRLVAGDPEAVDGRSDLLYGAYLAGSSLGSVGMAVHHRVCHVLGGTYGLAHGDANAVMLPHVVGYNAVAEPDVMDRLASALGAGDPAAALYDLARELGAPASLSGLGVAESDLDAAAAMTVERGGYNPRPVELGWIRNLLGDAYTGGSPVVKRE